MGIPFIPVWLAVQDSLPVCLCICRARMGQEPHGEEQKAPSLSATPGSDQDYKGLRHVLHHLKSVSREILEGVERLGAVKVKEYVIPRTAYATVLVERVLERMTQLEEENRDLRRVFGLLNKIEGAVQETYT